jgi:hypothetical protein
MDNNVTRPRLGVNRETVRELTDQSLDGLGAGTTNTCTPVINTIPVSQCLSRIFFPCIPTDTCP